MNAIARFERFIADLIEGSVARALGARLEPVEIARQIDRAMDDHRLVSPSAPIAPNHYVVTLHPDDLAGLKEVQPVLAAELATYVTNRARERGWQLVGRPRIELVAATDPASSRPHEVRVSAHVAADAPPARDLGQTQRFPTVAPARPPRSSSPRPPASRPRKAEVDGARTPPIGDAPPRRPLPRPRAIVAESVGPAGSGSSGDDSPLRVKLTDQPIRIGRAFDNDLVLDDTRVSRYHVEIAGREGDVVLRDLGSKNGTLVNGRPVRECRLQVGDLIRLGAVELRVE